MTSPVPQTPQTPQEYAAQQALISAALAVFVAQMAKLFVNPALTAAEWLGMLRLIYPEVDAAREKSARLARSFYDTQRAIAHPDLPVLARDLEPYRFEWFAQSMEPVRAQMSLPQSQNTAVGQLASLAVREAENAGRRQIIKAVENDKPLAEKIAAQNAIAAEEKPGKRQRKTPKLTPDEIDEFQALLRGEVPQKRTTWGGQTVESTPKATPERSTAVRGWARVATGRETCAFCLMLISRGPVYLGTDTAGLNLPEDEVVQMFQQSDLNEYFEDISDFMEEWHPNCDCKVVPVFNTKSWVGRDESRKALEMWKTASLKAKDALEADPGKQYYSFKEKRWLPTTVNREAINQLRLMIADSSSADWAALHAA